MNKAIKFRIFPSFSQISLFSQTFGCCRKVWNLMLADKKSAYKSDKSVINPTPAQYKIDFPFLKDVDSLALANVQLNLQKAFSRFFTIKDSGFPKFKSKKKSKRSYTTNNQKGSIRINGNYIKLPKVGWVKVKIHRQPKEGWKIKSATVIQTKDSKYYCSVLFEYETDIKQVVHPEKNSIGLDYKSDGLYTDSNGNTCGSPKFYRKGQKRLKKAQRKLRHKKLGSNNYRKAKQKIAREHQHIANQRKDYLHKKSTEIANQYDMVCVEDLDMKAMSNKGFGNGKATMDNGYGMFLNMLEYKLQERGKKLIKVDKWYASSQICSRCGAKNKGVKDLRIREWTCPKCGAKHDRDINAAKNILSEGKKVG